MADPRGEPDRAADVVVIGAGVGGLGAALCLARAGRHVTLLERDPAPTPATVEDAFAAERRGAPQVRHSHGLAARLHQLLATRLPDVLDGLRGAGVVEHDLAAMMPPEIAGQLDGVSVIAARRATYEWVLRRAVLAERSARLLTGAGVAGVSTERPRDDGPPKVNGVLLADGTELRASAVIAAAGRRGDVVGWLAAHGVEIPETTTRTGITYFSRFYRLRPGRTLDGGILQATSRRAGVNYMCVAADNATFSLTLAVDSNDSELRRLLHDPERYEAVCRLLPGIDTLVDPDLATPISDVNAMGGLINRLRRFVDRGGRPLVTGFHAVGDAHTTTNPLYGRGCALAMLQAALLADAFDAHPSDPLGRAMSYEQASRREVEPWYHFAVDGDALRAAGDTVDPEDRRFTLRDVMRVGAAAPELLPKTLRAVTLLDTPDVVAGDPRFHATLQQLRRQHAEKLVARQAAGYSPPLTRDDLVAAAAAHGPRPAAAGGS